jgi:hypothetical protein
MDRAFFVDRPSSFGFFFFLCSKFSKNSRTPDLSVCEAGRTGTRDSHSWRLTCAISSVREEQISMGEKIFYRGDGGQPGGEQRTCVQCRNGGKGAALQGSIELRSWVAIEKRKCHLDCARLLLSGEGGSRWNAKPPPSPSPPLLCRDIPSTNLERSHSRQSLVILVRTLDAATQAGRTHWPFSGTLRCTPSIISKGLFEGGGERGGSRECVCVEGGGCARLTFPFRRRHGQQATSTIFL